MGTLWFRSLLKFQQNLNVKKALELLLTKPQKIRKQLPSRYLNAIINDYEINENLKY